MQRFLKIVNTPTVFVDTDLSETPMVEEFSILLVLIDTVVVVSESFMVLAKHLVALTSVHVVLSEFRCETVFLFLLGSYRSTEVVQSSLKLLHGHIASTSHAEGSSIAYKTWFKKK